MSAAKLNKIKNHETFLRKNIFFTNSKWPHFNLLFKDINRLSKQSKKMKVLIIERSFLYGSVSLLAPFFSKHDVVSIDCTPSKLIKRGSYNKKLTLDPRIIKFKTNYHFDYKNIKFNKKVDLLIIPNLIHHISDHDILIKNCKKLLKKGGKIYIFEPTLREIHQKPEDYVRFTPYGIKNLLSKFNFKNFKIKEEGSVFTSIIYCWDQAFQYMPKKIRNTEYKKFIKNDYKKLLKFEKKYKKNLIRKNSKFPLSYSVTAKKS
tara:strand:- start:381 stop:1163 length:783 start_codon:yes stop_codon:yes gene_type:complete